eukprot:CAMPEP_0181309574 /NCGR_PEP_ID=MMETSP1101-20121128/12085_1 /TAXON_ID=46948 /ORGANISM="Rhodomonas abbreviata, Strain Caron Lab Isolate" /LENGTH=178 /DNA_ID=CAMNT_0023416065 /DNA_START=230 /DNA_END=766 /DNA_ORIENTATION=-
MVVSWGVNVSTEIEPTQRGGQPVELFLGFPDPGATTRANTEKQYLRAEDAGMIGPPRAARRRQVQYEMGDAAAANENFLQKYIKYGNPTTRKEKGGTNDLISMAIHDIRSQHDKRISKVLNKEMRDAAQDYANNIKKEVNVQNSYVRSRDKARTLEKKIVRAREKKVQKANNSWLNLF